METKQSDANLCVSECYDRLATLKVIRPGRYESLKRREYVAGRYYYESKHLRCAGAASGFSDGMK